MLLVFFHLLSVFTLARAVYYDPHENAIRDMAPPDTYDLRKSGRLKKPVDQRDCNSCYIHAVTSVLEYWANEDISDQMVMDCFNGASGRYGCATGGYTADILDWLHLRRLPVYDNDTPFTATDGECVLPTTDRKLVVFDYGMTSSEKFIDHILWTSGPVISKVYLTDELRKWPGGRVMEPSECGRKDERKLHTVAIVGYTHDEWIIKNSWGQNWADGGYARLRRNARTCGIGMENYFITNAGIESSSL